MYFDAMRSNVGGSAGKAGFLIPPPVSSPFYYTRVKVGPSMVT